MKSVFCAGTGHHAWTPAVDSQQANNIGTEMLILQAGQSHAADWAPSHIIDLPGSRLVSSVLNHPICVPLDD